MSKTAHTAYVLGFLFDPRRERVLLLEKQHPEWQKGKCNGIGGKIEPGEQPYEAIEREAREEIGVESVQWKCYAVMRGKDWTVYVFRAFGYEIYAAEGQEDEPAEVHDIDDLPPYVLPNLRWLIPLALDSEPQATDVRYAEQSNAELKAQGSAT